MQIACNAHAFGQPRLLGLLALRNITDHREHGGLALIDNFDRRRLDVHTPAVEPDVPLFRRRQSVNAGGKPL